MCQKATGGPFQIVAIVSRDALTWTRGQLGHFRSSSIAERGFCAQCGTPLTYEWDGTALGLAIGAFDDPTRFSLDTELSRETRLPCISQLGAVARPDMAASADEAAQYARMTNFQHPDHDTDHWPHTGART